MTPIMAKIKRQVLIDTIDRIFQRYKDDQAAYDQAFEEFMHWHRTEWLREQMPRWITIRDWVSECNKRKQPITKEMVVSAFGKNAGFSGFTLPYYQPPVHGREFEMDDKKWSYPHNHRERPLMALRAALVIIEDDTVSTSGLADLGFRNLEEVFREAVATQ